MFLTAYNLTHYLIARGIVSAESVVAGDLVLVEAGRRNRNFKVLRRRNSGLFVKQIKSFEDQAITTLRREAAFYRAINSNSRYSEIAGLIPEFIDYDERRHALSVKLVENAQSVAERQMNQGKYLENTARDLGCALGRIHSKGSEMMADPALRNMLTYQVPWPMMLDQLGYTFLEQLGRIGPELAAALRGLPTLQRMLSDLRPHWQYDSLIHGDMKWDNCMTRDASEETAPLTIVDWELADIGDGAWDLAGILKEYVMAVVLNGYARESAQAQSSAMPAAIRLEDLQPSVRAFWAAYAGARRLTNGSVYLARAVRFTGARVVSAVLEYLFSSSQLGTLGTTMLQVSANILEAPHVAEAQLLGSNGATA